MSKMRKVVGSVILGIAVIAEAGAVKVSAIKYVGCERIEKETVSAYFPIRVGDECSTETINDALKALQETNFFSDVKVKMDGSTVIVEVQEAPIINKISFEGNSKISDKDIKKVLRLNAREPLSAEKVKLAQQSLLQNYRKMGRYNATVSPKIIKLKDNKVNLVFEINEGKAAGISRIVFIGNEKVSSSDLREVIHSKVKKWFRFFVSDDVYDADRLEEDKQIISRYYHDQGYLNARVLSAVAELDPRKNSFVLTFTIDEGNLYTFGDISITSHLPKVSAEGLDKDLLCRKGDVYRESFVEADTNKISRMIGQRGFPVVSVSPQMHKNPKTNVVGVVFNINEGEKIYISKIVITGNAKTRDSVIRRELVMEEGDAYNQSFVKMSEGRLWSLGYFTKVNIQALPDPTAPDKCVLHVNVEEGPTAEFWAQAAYSTTTGLGIELRYNESNFLGTGKGLSVFLGSSRSASGKSRITNEDGSTSTENKKAKFRFFNNMQLAVSDPHVFDKDMEGSVSFHRNVTSLFDGFNSNELGTSVGLSYELSPKWSQSWSWTLDRRKFQNVSKSLSPIILTQIQKNTGNKLSNTSATNILSEISHKISYSTYFIRELKGSLNMSLDTSIAGIGGDARHLKNVLSGVYVIPVFRETSLKFQASTGVMTKLGGRDPHIMDSFILGGDSFRGFEYAGVGPMASTLRDVTPRKLSTTTRYSSRLDFVGAKKFWKGTVEYTFPVGLPEELQFRGYVFSDFGALWDAPNKKNKYIKQESGTVDDAKGLKHDKISFGFDDRVVGQKVFDKRQFKQSIGGGVKFMMPFGMVMLGYAKPIKKSKHDEQQRVLFGMTNSF